MDEIIRNVKMYPSKAGGATVYIPKEIYAKFKGDKRLVLLLQDDKIIITRLEDVRLEL